jgi:Restriction alleviation protein Lar
LAKEEALMEALKPCPCCGGDARLEHGKKYRVMIQDWHDVEEEQFLPATVLCKICGLSMGKAANVAECGSSDAAFNLCAELAIAAWNKRA